MEEKEKLPLDFLRRLAKGLALQFGSDCEVLVHDLTADNVDHTIAVIENGHVSDRKLGDGPSPIVLAALSGGGQDMPDQLGYLSRTHDGRVLKSSTIYIKDALSQPIGILSINYDITSMQMANKALLSFMETKETESAELPDAIPQNVNDLLAQLIGRSVDLVGKPVAMMNKEDKIRAIQFLNQTGAFLITKSGDKIARYFGISKYTLYNYMDSPPGDA